MAALACVLLTSACSFFDEPQPIATAPRPGAACAALGRLSRDKTPTARELVLVIDRSASMRDAETRQTADWYTAIFGGRGVPLEDGSISFGAQEKSLIPLLPTPAVIKIGAIDGGESIAWQGAPVYLPRMTGGERNRTEFAGNTSACLRELVDGAARNPGKPGTNVMAAFRVGQLGITQARHTLIVVTDGLATTGCADLRQTAMRDVAHAARIVRSCDAQRAVPDLTGWEVRLPWVGSVGQGHPEPQEPHLQWLRTLWSGMCAQATNSARNCTIESGSRPAPVPAATAPTGSQAAAAAEPEDERIKFLSVEEPPNPVQVETLPSDVLFATDSDQLSARGLTALASFTDKVIPKAPEWLKVLGHTDDQGDAAYNMDLSKRRAGAVRRVLKEAGLGNVHVVGMGEKAPKCAGTSPADRRCNRRVEIKYKVRG
ncbi:OmpA family protein [Nonomuraea sp. NPDC052129]|uniref:OmpA family protein n=1 Tax=Nonomuraea sp. NPDC052129 TaxID=3154651 RepID=UPI003442CBED